MALGSEIVLAPGPKGMKGAIAKAAELQAGIPGSVILQQFANPANPRSHRETTGPEIWDDTDGKIDILISGVGTGGTLTGVGEYIRPRKPSFKMVEVEPKDSPVLSGGAPSPPKIQGIGAGFIPQILRIDLIDEVIQTSTDGSVAMARRLAKEEGLLPWDLLRRSHLGRHRSCRSARERRHANRRRAARLRGTLLEHYMFSRACTMKPNSCPPRPSQYERIFQIWARRSENELLR